MRLIAVAIALAFTTGSVSADSRSEAKTHYQAGVKFYNSGDYRSAIREFSSAQQLAPADLNLYNLALCYDKLGDPEPAIQNYRAFLDRQPNSDKRAEIEASISRLESQRPAPPKEDPRKADDLVKREAEAARREEAARQAEEARQEDARRAEEARRIDDAQRGGAAAPLPPPTGAGTTRGGPPSGGDPQLDRVQQIDVDRVRDQRMGRTDPGMGATAGPNGPSAGPSGPNGPSADPNGGYDPNARQVASAAPPPSDPMAPAPIPDDKPKGKPLYKKWWFWAVVAVGVYVVYAVATEDSRDSDNFSRVMPPLGSAPQQSGGVTLMRW